MFLDGTKLLRISRYALLMISMSFAAMLWAQSPNLNQLAELETAVEKAKAAHAANPSAANLANLDQAQAQYLAFFNSQTPPRESNSYLAQVNESEPNGTALTASGPLTPGTDSGAGDITPATDRDFWQISGVTMGDLIFVVIDTEPSTTGADTEMSVFDNDGTTLIEFDDDSGDGLASAVVAIAPTTGSVFAEINEFDDNGEITPYELFQVVVSPGAGVAEVESNDAFGTATALTSPLTTGDIAAAGNDDFFSFAATTGDRIVVVVDNDPDTNANNSDMEITILDTDGTTTLATESPFTVTGQNSALATAANTGTHFIQLSDGGGGDGDTTYRFTVIVGGTPVPVELQSFSVE